MKEVEFAWAMKSLGLPIDEWRGAPPDWRGGRPAGWTDHDVWRVYLESSASFRGKRPKVQALLDFAMSPELVERGQLAHRGAICDWAKRNLPDYELIWPERLAREAREASRRAYGKEIGELFLFENGVLFSHAYAALFAEKKIPLANHHDLLTHLPLMLEPKLAELSLRSQVSYRDFCRGHLGDESPIAETLRWAFITLWNKIQEKFFFLEQESLSILGGHTALGGWWLDPRYNEDGGAQLLNPLDRSYSYRMPLTPAQWQELAGPLLTNGTAIQALDRYSALWKRLGEESEEGALCQDFANLLRGARLGSRTSQEVIEKFGKNLARHAGLRRLFEPQFQIELWRAYLEVIEAACMASSNWSLSAA